MINTSIIIVNWNGRRHLEKCLRSVFSRSGDSFELIFVDNGSSDGSVEFVKKNFPTAKIIEGKKNLGFAEGNNVGIRRALKNSGIKYVACLNNDTEVKDGWLAALVSTLEKDGRAGAVCAKTLFFDRRDIIDSAGDFILSGTMKAVCRGYGEQDGGQYEREAECFSARAAAALYRRETLDDICLNNDYFDRRFFAYIEDTDLSVRARLRGWKIFYQPRAVVYHKVAATSGKISRLFRKYYSGRNRLFCAIKNYPLKMWPPALAGQPADQEAGLDFFSQARVYGKIFFSLLFSLPRLLTQRGRIQKNKKISRREIDGWPERFSIG